MFLQSFSQLYCTSDLFAKVILVCTSSRANSTCNFALPTPNFRLIRDPQTLDSKSGPAETGYPTHIEEVANTINWCLFPNDEQGFIQDCELGGSWGTGWQQDDGSMCKCAWLLGGLWACLPGKFLNPLDPLRLLLTQSGTNFPNNILMTHPNIKIGDNY